MMPEEKMQENLNVLLRSSFFVPLLKRMTGQKDELPDEGAGKYQEISREMQREEEKKQEQDPKAQPQEEAQPQVSYREERQVVEQVWEQPGLQEISDELERLSGRYQTRMEEWLDDQSAI